MLARRRYAYPLKKRGRLIAVVAGCGSEDYYLFQNLATNLQEKNNITDPYLWQATIRDPTCFLFLDWIAPHFINYHQVDGVYSRELSMMYKKGYYRLAAKLVTPRYRWAYDTALGFFMICLQYNFDINKKFAQLEVNQYKRLDYLRERKRYNANRKKALKDSC